MSLPSQSGSRGGAGRSMMSRKRRLGVPRQALLVGGGAILLLGCAWVALSMFSDGGSTKRSAKPEPAGSNPKVLAMDDPSLRGPQTPPRREERPTHEEPIPSPTDEREPVAGPGPDAGGGQAPGAGTPREPIPAPPPVDPGTQGVADALRRAEQQAPNAPLEARATLNSALRDVKGERDRAALREALGTLNERILFSPYLTPGDPMCLMHTIGAGDYLSTLPKKHKLGTDWRLIQRINRIADPNRIRGGQQVKLVRGPFHAKVDKSEYRLDLYWGDPEKKDEWVFIRSFAVGLGELDSTPVGEYVVRNREANPSWRNPRTGERFDRDDPKNPIGEYWVGLDGLGEAAKHTGYGLHGTVEPQSIGRQMSMGCVRLLDDEIALVFSMLTEKVSLVTIEP